MVINNNKKIETPPQQQQKVVKKENRLASLVPGKGSWEIPRKLFHFTSGFISMYLNYIGMDPRHVYPLLTSFLVVVATGELLRFNWKAFNKLYCSLLGPLMRQTEIKKINGVIYYLLGCIIVLYLFPRDLAALSVIYLSWTDPTASVCGKLWGKYTPQYGGKSLAGSLGAAVLGALVTFVYFGPLAHYPLSYISTTSPVPLWALSIYGGLVAALSEGTSNLLFGLDDNFTIPVISATLLWIPLVGFGLGQ